MSDRQLHLGLWLSYIDPTTWRDENSRAEEVNALQPYIDIAKAAEKAKLDAIIRGDGVNLQKDRGSAAYAGSLEIITLISAIGAVTNRIGLIGTASTTFNEPYNLARQFASVDHITGGRVGWNIVTSAAGEKNFGYEEIPDQDSRYERADEFIDVVTQLWNSWEKGSVPIDKESGVFTRQELIHAINHSGTHFKVEGPLNVARSPQTRPVYIQAGSSETGRRFAAKHAEVIFTAQQTIEDAQAFYSDLKNRVASNGRDPEQVKILPGLGLYLGETEEEAQSAYAARLDLIDYQQVLRSFEESLGGVDLSDIELDDTVPAERFPDTSTLKRRQSRPQVFIDLAVKEGYSLRKVLQSFASGYGHGQIVGTPEQAAERIATWWEQGAADGFVLFPTSFRSIELLTEKVVPILQETGIFRIEYEGNTLRDHFGLPEL